MPFLKVQSSIAVVDKQKEEILSALTKIIVEVTGKPAKFTMVALEQIPLVMGDPKEKAAFLDYRSIGSLNAKINAQLSKRFCDYLEQVLKIPADKVYITFLNVPADHWGWNGGTF